MSSKNWLAGLFVIVGLGICLAAIFGIDPEGRRNPIQAGMMIVIGVALFIYGCRLDRSAKKK